MNLTDKQLLELAGVPLDSKSAQKLLNESDGVSLNETLEKVKLSLEYAMDDYIKAVRANMPEIEKASEKHGYMLTRGAPSDDVIDAINKAMDEVSSLQYNIYGDDSK